MAKGYFIQRGEVLDYRNDTSDVITYGDVIVLGARVGVAESDIAVGQLGVVSVSGVYQLPATAADSIAMGAAVYWDADSGTVTITEKDVACGFAAAAKASGATEAVVKIG